MISDQIMVILKESSGFSLSKIIKLFLMMSANELKKFIIKFISKIGTLLESNYISIFGFISNLIKCFIFTSFFP